MEILLNTIDSLSFLAGSVLIILGILAFLAAWQAGKPRPEQKRLQTFVVQPATQQVRDQQAEQIRQRELRGSFATRVITPTFRSLGRLLGRFTPARTMQELERKLFIAGNPLGLHGREFYGLRLAFSLLSYVVVYLVLRQGINLNNTLLAAFVMIIANYLPRTWLNSMANRRKNKIRKGLPDALDMLSVCADAGLGFDQSLQRVSEYWRTPLGVELGRVVQEMEMGVGRQEALRNLADRFDVEELNSFVAVIVQSDSLGMSIAETLNGQAKQMRVERRYRAMEQARKIPLKMLFPMLLFILPAMFAVVLGPAIPALQQMFSSIVVAP